MDGEHPGDTTKVYLKVHQANLSFFGTGKIQGHMKAHGVVSRHVMRCVIATPVIVALIVLILLLVGFGYFIRFLASL